jgi:DMSO/TMAO reductase YedYZ molybdopterin-dependent catalytic subunit
LPQARYVVFFSIDKDWWDSIDMADALHSQTLLTHGMNDGDLPVSFGGALRMRVPRQLGYKSVKYITHLTVTDSLKSFGKGLDSSEPDYGYAWYAGIYAVSVSKPVHALLVRLFPDGRQTGS